MEQKLVEPFTLKLFYVAWLITSFVTMLIMFYRGEIWTNLLDSAQVAWFQIFWIQRHLYIIMTDINPFSHLELSLQIWNQKKIYRIKCIFNLDTFLIIQSMTCIDYKVSKMLWMLATFAGNAGIIFKYQLIWKVLKGVILCMYECLLRYSAISIQLL